MRYAILGDIHANLTALEAVLADVRETGVDRIVSVGDVVGYGAAASEVIQLLRELQIAVVKGNHDAACIGELDTTFFNPHARAAVEWTRERLSDDEASWLRGLPLVMHLEHCSVAHGTYATPERFDYVLSTEDADASLDQQPLPVCFVGHTHVPVTILRLAESPTRTSYTMDDEVDLSEATRALINAGSVGQPRDEDSRAAWGLFDAEAQRFEMKRVTYDIGVEAQRIRAQGLPAFLADRLYLGV
jgi:diadenosine tetraphosphatase ApaH/serine/threonine PP2A family protein phosphatase